MSRAQINKLQIPWHKCLVDPNQLVLMTSFVFFSFFSNEVYHAGVWTYMYT